MQEIEVGVPRLGVMLHGENAAVAMLMDTGSSLELTLPLDSAIEASRRYERWWSSNVTYGDDPERTIQSYAPPRSLGFRDGNGSLVLVGCRAGDAVNTIMARTGHGRIVANYAVIGAHVVDYETINGLRSEAPAIAAWTRLSGINVDVQRDEQTRAKAVRMDLESPPDVSLAADMNLLMHMTWHTEAPTGRFVAEEAVQLQTLVKKRRTWDEHIKVHAAVLHLVSISAWTSFGFERIEAQIDNDRIRTAPNSLSDARWLPVSTYRLIRHQAWARDPKFLFPYEFVGPRGVKRWLRLVKDYKRAIDPLLNVLYSDDPWGPHSVVQSGIALEALGYLIDVKKNSGAHLNGREQMNFKPGLSVILADMEAIPLDDAEAWIERCYAVYMGSKHVDRPMPDSLDMINTLRENLLVLRFWIGQQLGVPASVLWDGLHRDKLRSNFIGLE